MFFPLMYLMYGGPFIRTTSNREFF